VNFCTHTHAHILHICEFCAHTHAHIQELEVPFIPNQPVDCFAYIEWIRMGTTAATNALLDRKGERMIP